MTRTRSATDPVGPDLAGGRAAVRTRARPPPRSGIFWWEVNPLSAWLALGGLLFYVFIYTVWLKRSSPQNIVIGGAAGRFRRSSAGRR